MEFLPLNGIIILQNMLSKKVISKKIYIFASNTKSGEWNSFHKISLLVFFFVVVVFVVSHTFSELTN